MASDHLASDPHIPPFLPFKETLLVKKQVLSASPYGLKDGPSHLFPASPPLKKEMNVERNMTVSGRETSLSSPLSPWIQLALLCSWGFSSMG